MSGTTGQGGGAGAEVPILKLGIDTTGVEQGQKRVEQSTAAIKTSAADAARAWDSLTERMGKVPQAATPAAQATTQVAQATTAAGKAVGDAAKATADYSRVVAEIQRAALASGQAIGTMGAAARQVSAQSIAAAAQQAKAMDDVRRRYDLLYDAEMRHAQAQREIADAVRAGAISQNVAQEALKRAAAAHANQTAALTAGTNAMRLQGHQITNLVYQLQDAAVQLSMGQNPFMILMQQGPQATGAVGGVSNALKLMGQFVNPVTVSVGALAAASATYLVVLDRQQAALGALRSQLRQTRADYEQVAQAAYAAANNVAPNSTLSRGEARTAAAAIAGERDFDIASGNLERYTRLAADLAKVMGVDVKEAGEKMGRAIRDPAEIAREYARTGAFGFDDALRRQVALLQATGDKAGATTLVMERWRERVQGAAEDVGLFARAWNAVTNAIEAATIRLERFLTSQPGQSGARAPNVSLGGIETGVDPFGLGQSAPGPSSISLGGRSVPLAQQLALLPRDATPDQIRAATEAQAGAMGYSPEMTALALRMFQQESGFRQFRPDGSLVTSRAGALGIAQLMPRTAAGLGVDPANPTQNVVGGLLYLQQLAAQFGNDQSLLAAAYNAGPGRVSRFQADPRVGLPGETWDYLGRVSAQGSLTGQAGVLGPALRGIRGYDSRGDRAGLLEAEIGTYQRALDAGGLDPDTTERLAERIRDLRRELVATRDPLVEQQRAAREAAAAYGITAGAARDLAEAERTARDQAERQGASEQQAVVAGLEARAVAQQRLTGQFEDSLSALTRSTEAAQAEAAAMMESGRAAQEVADQRRAEREALQTAAIGTTEYQRQVELLTQAYGQQRAAAVDLQTAQAALASREQIETLETQRRLIGASAEERERELAALRQRQTILRAGGDPDSEVSRSAVAMAQQQASLRLEVDRTAASYDALANIGVSAFERVSSALVTGLAQGTVSTIEWGNVFKATIASVASDLLRLAAINPLRNWLLGGNLPTLGSAGGVVGSLFGGLFGGGTATNGGYTIPGDVPAGTFSATGLSGALMGAGAGMMFFQPSAQGGYGPPAPAGYGGGSGGGFTNLLSMGRSVFSAGQTAYNLLTQTALTQGGSLFGEGSMLAGLFNTPLFGAGGTATMAPTSLAGVNLSTANPFTVLPTMSGSSTGTVSLGSIALPVAGIAAGFAGGSFIGGRLAANRGSVAGQQNAMIGAGAGALGGAAIGAFGGPIGAAIGALIGGIAGGSGGGLIGPKLHQNAAVRWGVGDDGALRIDSVVGKNFPLWRAQRDMEDQLAVVNEALGPRGIYWSRDDQPGVEIFASEGYGKQGSPTTMTVGDAVWANRGRLRSDNPNVQTVLSNTRRDNIDAVLRDVDWTTSTYEPAIAEVRKQSTEFDDAMKRVVDSFFPVIKEAGELGLATDELVAAMERQKQALWEDRAQRISELTGSVEVRRLRLDGQDEAADLRAFDISAAGERLSYRRGLEELAVDADEITRRMVELERVQADERLAIQKQYAEQAVALEEQRVQRLAEVTGNLQIRRLRLSDTPEANQQADLLAYDLSASAERLSFRDTLKQLSVGTEEAAARMVELEKLQADERLAIQKRYADEAKALEEQRQASVAQTIVSLSSYARGLRYGEASPLPATARLEAASREFDAVSSAAAAGNWESIQRLPEYANTLLAASRTVYGSGAGYVQDYNRVLASLDGVAQQSSEALTAAALDASLQTQTTVLAQKLDELRAEVAGMRSDVRQTSTAPARVAA